MLTGYRYGKFAGCAAAAVMLACFALGEVRAQSDGAEFYPAHSGPFAGNWKGRWAETETVDPDISAQVVPLGGDRYQIRLAPKLFMRCPPLAIANARVEDGVLRFRALGYSGEIRDGVFSGNRRAGRVPFTMSRYLHVPPNLGAAPPPNAIVLYDGSGFDAWENAHGWVPVENNAMMVTPEAGDLVSKQRFHDVRLHVEFRLPLMPGLGGQSRGNSGVFVQDVYEVQILDSFGLEGYYDECGALYKVSAPYVNACLPPLEWQTYEITFRAARFDANGEVREYPRMTVLHNGFVIQKEQEMPQITAWKEADRLQPPPREPGAIRLQSHRSHYVQFRNIWMVDLGYEN